jgi:hypothetical protein
MTFETDLIEAVQKQRQIKQLNKDLATFKETYNHLLNEENPVEELPTGEKFFFREGVDAKGPNGSLKEADAILWFRQAIKDKKITRHQFEKLTKPHNGRKASYIISGPSSS